MNMPLGRPRLGELLLREGIVDSGRLRAALDRQAKLGGTLGTNLLELGAVREKLLLRALGRLFGCPTVDAEALAEIDPRMLQLVPPELARRLAILPFGRESQQLCIAAARPDVHVENETTLATSSLVRTHAALDVRLRVALNRHYRLPLSPRLASLAAHLDSLASQQGAPPPNESILVQRPKSIAELLGEPTVSDDPAPGERPPRPTLVHPRRKPPRAASVKTAPGASNPETDAAPDARAANEASVRGAEGPPPLDIPALHLSFGDGAPGNDGWDQAMRLLASTDDRDTALKALIGGCSVLFQRVLVFQRRADGVVGWAGSSTGVAVDAIAELIFDVAECAPFAEVDRGVDAWRGVLPAGRVTTTLASLLGNVFETSNLLALRIGSRTLGFVYLDRPSPGTGDRNTGTGDLARARDLIQRAEAAFARAIAKRTPAKKSPSKRDHSRR